MLPISALNKSHLSRSELEQMVRGGNQIKEAHRVLKKSGLNVVGECMKNQGDFIQLNHYPKGDVYDNESHAQYYYHSHRGMQDEHGHFHTFLRSKGIPAGIQPIENSGMVEWPQGDEAVSHIISISMDKYGFPIGLFAVNRWVTGETWYPANDVKQMATLFEIDHAWPNLAVNQWISGMFKLFQPEIHALLEHRDQVISQWRKDQPESDVFEDRELEITGFFPVSVDRHHNEAKALLNAAS